MPVTIDGTTGITTPNLINGSSLNFRNKIINGNFDIWQRGTSLASGTGARYLADRWTNGATTATYTPSRQAFTAGQPDVPNEPAFFHRTVVVSGNVAGSNATLHQHIESVRTFAGKTVTLSFYAKTPTAPEKVAIEFYQYFGTGGSSAVSIPAGSFNLTTSWQKFTVTVNIPSISTKTIGGSSDDYLTVYFWFDAESTFGARASNIGYQSGTFDIAQVQIEEGSVATPFEERPIGTELALCQRYYQNGYAIGVINDTSAGTNASRYSLFHSFMGLRVPSSPTVILYGSAGNPLNTSTYSNPNRFGRSGGIYPYNQSTFSITTHGILFRDSSSGTGSYVGDAIAAYLSVDAEL
jgi:hypothetical protein